MMSKPKQNLLEGDLTKPILLLTIPLLLGNLLQQLYNTVDSLIIGNFLGMEAFASTGVSGTLMNLFIFVLNGFCLGASIIFGQLYGAGDRKNYRRAVYTSLAFGSLVTIAMSALFILLLTPLLHLISTPQALMSYCRAYLTLILAGLITTYLYNLFSNILRSVGDTRASLYFLLISVLGNAGMDYVFVGPCHFGIRGAAAATVIAQGFSAVCCFFYIRKKYPELLFTKEDMGLHTDLLGRIFRFGSVSALQQSSLYFGKLMVQGVVNTCGTSVIAAYTATTRIEAFLNSAGEAGSQATTIAISQNYGAGNIHRVRRAFRICSVIFYSFAAVMSVVMTFAAPFFLQFFLDPGDTAAMTAGRDYLRIIFIFYVFCYAGYIFAAHSKGIGRISISFTATTLHLSIRFLLSYLLVGRLGLAAVAWASGVGWLCSTSFNSIVYYRIYHSGKGKMQEG